MLWHLIDERDHGRPTPELDARPKLYGDLVPVYDLWRAARASRPRNERLSVAEVSAALDAFAIHGPERVEWAELLLGLEAELAHLAEKNHADPPPSDRREQGARRRR